MNPSNLRTIVDTNLWISFLISGTFHQLEQLLTTNKLLLLFSEELLQEFLDVIQRPKLSRYFEKFNIEMLFESIQDYIEFIEVNAEVDICRDKKDNFLLALAKDGKADILITGDKDLLVLKNFESTQIMTFPEFLNLS